MSYDLMVFDTKDAPRTRQEFMPWYFAQTEWPESHGYNDPAIPSAPLRIFFREIIQQFPPMNGPLAVDDPDDPAVTDYALGRSIIYMAFSGPMSDVANRRSHELAAKHGIGFFDLTGDGVLWWPGAEGTLRQVKA